MFRAIFRWFMWYGCLLFGHDIRFEVTDWNTQETWLECSLCGAKRRKK